MTDEAPRLAPPRSGARLAFVDGARGFAVLYMIQWHCTHAWTAAPWRATTAFELAQAVGGLAAPGFLLLAGAGMSLRWAAAARRGETARATALALVRRGALLVLLGYLLRLQLALATGSWRSMLRFDVLQAIGASMALAALLALGLRALPRHPGRVLAAGLLVFAATPHLAHALPPELPAWLTAPLVRPAGEAARGTFALFPLFPYAGHVLVGLALGAAWDRAGRGVGEGRVVLLTTLLGLALCATCFERVPVYHWLAARLPGPDPGAPLRHLSRDGALLVTSGVAFALVRLAPPLSRVLADFGRASMPVYWIHLSVAYLTPPRRLEPAEVVAATAALTAAMWIVARIRLGPYERWIRRLRARGQAPAEEKSTRR